MVFWSDYPSFADVPETTESFNPSPEQLDYLYESMVTQGLFTEQWQAQADPADWREQRMANRYGSRPAD